MQFYPLCKIIVLVVLRQQLKFSFVDRPLSKQKQLGELHRCQYLSELLKHLLVALTVPLDLLLLLQDLFGASENFPRLDTQRLTFLQKQFLVAVND